MQALGDDSSAQSGDIEKSKKKLPANAETVAAPTDATPARMGALEETIRSVLVAAGKQPMSVFEIRDELLKMPFYQRRDPQQLYTMISARISQMEGLKEVRHKYCIVNKASQAGF